MAQAFDGVVVEVDLGDLGAVFLEAGGVGGETVVLGGDGDFAGLEVFHRLVAAAVTEFEFKRRAAEGVREHLVAEADAENGVIGNQLRHGLVDVAQGGGIAGAVGEEYRVDFMLADFFGAGRGGEHVDVETVAHEFAKNGVLRAEIEGGDLEALRRWRRGLKRGADGEVSGVVV